MLSVYDTPIDQILQVARIPMFNKTSYYKHPVKVLMSHSASLFKYKKK